jgi:hypothetical protein
MNVIEQIYEDQPVKLCRCCTPGAEWDGHPDDEQPDTHWRCDDCGRLIAAE